MPVVHYPQLIEGDPWEQLHSFQGEHNWAYSTFICAGHLDRQMDRCSESGNEGATFHAFDKRGTV